MQAWIGKHPVLAVNLATGLAVLLGLVAWIVGMGGHAPPAPSWSGAVRVGAALLLSAGFILGVPLATCRAACIVGRAGGRMSIVVDALFWTPVVCGSAVVVAMLMVFPKETVVAIAEGAVVEVCLAALTATTVLSLVVGAMQLVGWGVAERIVARRIRNGRWEVTRRAEDEG